MAKYLKILSAAGVLFGTILFICLVRPDASMGLLSLFGSIFFFVYVSGGHWKKR